MDPRQTAPPRDPYGDGLYAEDPAFDERFGDYGVPPPRSRSRGPDPAALFVLLDALRRAVPRDLERRVTELIREFLLTLRSLIDWYLERLDRPSRQPEVEEIKID